MTAIVTVTAVFLLGVIPAAYVDDRLRGQHRRPADQTPDMKKAPERSYRQAPRPGTADQTTSRKADHHER